MDLGKLVVEVQLFGLFALLHSLLWRCYNLLGGLLLFLLFGRSGLLSLMRIFPFPTLIILLEL